MSPYESVLGVLFAGWLVVSAIAQLGVFVPRLREYRTRFDLLGLIPLYHFFAPLPGTHDYHLLIRTRALGCGLGAWREVTPEHRRRWWNFAWNPDRRHHKQMFDLATALTKNDHTCSDPATPLSVPYLLLLRYATTLVEPAEGVQVQFLIARSAGVCSVEPPQALFLSRFHRVG